MDWRTQASIISATQIVIMRLRLNVVFMCVLLIITCLEESRKRKRKRNKRYSMIEKILDQIKHIRDLVHVNDEDCINHFRMDRNAFHRLCYLLENIGGLTHTKYVSVQEQTAIFLQILAHHHKHRTVKFDFKRSCHTISHYFNRALEAVLKIHELLLVKPKPITPDCNDQRWKPFQGCLGALDGTYIKLRVPIVDQVRYRSRKGDLVTNVLGVCDINKNFVYILTGWEGSAADSRVLRDAIARPTGLKVPTGNYYLCDNGYTNGEGFLTPYRSCRYHLDENGPAPRRPRTSQEFFNMKHCKARNVIECAFGLLKGRWAILETRSHYSITVRNRIIMACALLHNFIRLNMSIDPLEASQPQASVPNQPEDDTEYIDVVEPSPEWNAWRDTLALQMFNRSRCRRR